MVPSTLQPEVRECEAEPAESKPRNAPVPVQTGTPAMRHAIPGAGASAALGPVEVPRAHLECEVSTKLEAKRDRAPFEGGSVQHGFEQPWLRTDRERSAEEQDVRCTKHLEPPSSEPTPRTSPSPNQDTRSLPRMPFGSVGGPVDTRKDWG